MKDFSSNNSRKNEQKNNSFIALKSKIQAIYSGFITFVTLLLLVAVLLFSSVDYAFSKKKQLPVQFGTDLSLNILPSEFESEGWGGISQAFTQDLTEDSLYQEFDARNSAYLLKNVEPEQQLNTNNDQFDSSEIESINSVPATSTSENIINLENSYESETSQEEISADSAAQEESENTDTTEQFVEPEPEPTNASEPDQENPVTEQTSYLSPGLYLQYPFPISSALYPLVNQSTTSPVEVSAASEPSGSSSDVDDTEISIQTELVMPSIETVETTTLLTEIVDESVATTTGTTSDANSPALELPTSIESTGDNLDQELDNNPEQEIVSDVGTAESVNEITLKNFNVPELEPGQFITGAQLRVSFAAQLERNVPSTTIPKIDVLFNTASSVERVGIILIEEEVSNAINGGYYLFGLPEFLSIEELSSASVTFRFDGDVEVIEGMFLDAAWLEIQTKVVTKDDIKARGLAKNLLHLESPKYVSMISEKTNFARDEAPLFHLRYNSQQNAIAREIRNLFGANVVEIEQVSVLHNALGLQNIDPEINVTDDGLITLAVQSDDLKEMRPGEYEIELSMKEGGKTYIETFNFQWGILTVNPDKSEYEINEKIQLSIGALTPSGNTICEANLDLYIINPLSEVERLLVEESGLCDGNNVIDVPDFSAESLALVPGEHELYLERLNDEGKVLGFVYDSFLVTPEHNLSIQRVGPTRIYPAADYPMTLTVEAHEKFSGKLIEQVPATFKISSTTAEISRDGDMKILTWDISLRSDSPEEFSYIFDAPDISPYLFELGPASLQGDSVSRTIEVASTTASTTDLVTVEEGGALFTEHREWKIASDAVGNMILFFDGATIPTGWDCVSCINDVSDPFYQLFVMGSSTYNSTGGNANHNHSVTTSLLVNSAATVESGSGGPAINTHTHTLTPTVGSETNLPEYRQLQVIQYTTAAGEPTTIPTGAIAIFDVASSSLPANWNRYSTQDGKYVYGENTIGTTGGSNEHSHTVSGTTGGSTGGTARTRGGGSQTTAATNGHTHTISTTTATTSNQPPYIEVVLAQASTDVTPVNGIIAMWTEEVGSGWLDVSSDPSDPFSEKFLKASTTYGGTGGGTIHTHPDINGAVTSGPSATTNGRSGSSGSDPNHAHNVNFTSFSSPNHLPPYLTAVFGKRQGTDPVYDQESYRWYTNEDNQTPTDPWSSGGGIDLSEREPVTATSTPVKNGDEIRLRINVGVTNATSTAGSDFKLQYSAADTCSAAGGWTDVGAATTSAIWRGYVNSGVTDSSTLSSQLLASSTVSATYEENGFASSTPNDISVGDWGEWDFVLQHNGAEAGTNYCFRMVERDDTTFFNYSYYPELYTNEAPTAPTQDKLFDNEKTASTSPWFYFSSTDAEGEKIHYQIQVDNNYDFGSTVIDRDTIDDSSQFENQVLVSDKAPFRQGEQIEFIPSTALTNGTTYYWRVRAQDPDGSQEWGSWSDIRSFTIDTTLTASAWFQTETEQFDTNTLTGIDTAGDQADLITGSTTGTMVSTAVTFLEGELGTAWDNLSFNETDGSSVLDYQVEYYDGSSWALIPDVDLPGNSTGFSSSPVSLIDLDTNTYGTIRVIADFTANTGTPSLQDWTINWGYRVDTPTITKLFPNEQTGTTTPTFEFTTADPQDDSLTYQISWSTTPDFAASTTRTSDAAPTSSFISIDNGTDYDPFDSGATIQFTVQPVDALTGTTTYWWRVRAKDTTGDNAYSFWTDVQSFTVIPGTEVSTWFQTTEEQFDADILSGTIAQTADNVTVATTASEAMIVYGEGTENAPKYRQWDGSTLGAEADMQDIGSPTRWAVVKAGTTREEYVAATLGTDGDVNAQVFALGAWSDLQEMTTTVPDVSARGFDVTYETLSGDAVVAYCDGDADPSYYVWNGSTWTSGGTINLANTNNCEWIELESDPTSDEIIILSRDLDGASSGSYEAQVWNGSSWGNSTTFGRIDEEDHAGMALMYEESGNQALILASDWKGGSFLWNSWNGTTWGTAAQQTIGDDFEWGQLVRDIGSDEMILCYQDEDTDIGVVRWTGSAWAGQTELEVNGNAKTDPAFACVFEDSSGRDNYILTTLSDTTQTEYSFWNNSTWSTNSQVNSIGDAATMQLIRTGDANILGTFFDDPNDSLLFTTWDGSSWSTTITMENDASVGATPFGHPYYMTPRNSGTEGTTIVSPGIDFDDGTGPYWDEFSWNETTPGTSEILYSMQYQTATGSWAFIPDSELPDNEAGTSTGPIDLSGLDTATYNVIRPYAALSCDGSNNCPTLDDWKVEWAGGITVSGTIDEYDQTTAVTTGSVALAVNGVLQTGKVGTISAGAWTIDNVTTFPGDIVTVFVTGAGDTNEAVGITRYDGSGDMDGITLFERHLSLGSNDATTTPITNADIGLYDFTNTEDMFVDVTANVLEICGGGGCFDAELYIAPSTYYTPGGNVVTHDFENNGIFTPGSNTIEVNGSWDNNATTTMTNSLVVFAATSTTENIDNTGAIISSFDNVIFGTTTGNGTWTASTSLDIDGDLTVSRGTLARATTSITVAGDVLTEANGLWTGIGTTTFDGGTAATWGDQNATLQNIGHVVIDGASKIVTLSEDVAAQSVEIAGNDTLDVSVSNYDVTVYGDWNNQNNFVSRSGEVFFAATSSGQSITTNSDAFYDLTFNGISGGWSFFESTILVDNDFTVATGTVTLPNTGTTTIDGSFDATGGTFQHNNSVLNFTSGAAETITFDGDLFTNVAYNLTFEGSGNWTVLDSNATSTNNVLVKQGTLNFPAGVFAIGGTLSDTGGSFVGGSGTVLFYGSDIEVISAGGSSFNNLEFDGLGEWSFSDTNVDIDGDLLVDQATTTLPAGVLTIGGSYTNNDVVISGTGTVTFDSTDTGETVDFGSSPLYNMIFDNATGGWTIIAHATTSASTTIANADSWTLQAGSSLSVGGVFTNSVGGASTTWTGSTLSLESGDYDINNKTDAGDAYENLRIAASADIEMWNSVSVSYEVNASGALYSKDHNATDGDLYVWGSYENTNGNEYWSYDTDFDGADLSGGNERQVNVRFANAASALLTDSVFEVVGDGSASTTVANQGSGTYTVDISSGTTTFQFYDFENLGSTGISLSDSTIVSSLRDGELTVDVPGGTALTISSTTIDANPAKQVFNVTFATTTSISANNVSQTDGVPTSFWWFRDGSGNLYGESFDNDTGDPGSIRFDDSSLSITISGTVYSDRGSTPLLGGTCNGVTNVVRVVVEEGSTYDTTCSAVTGNYSVSGVSIVGDPTVTVFLNDSIGGETGSVITRTPTADITDLDLYANRVIIRNEDTEATTITNLALYDVANDSDLRFAAATTSNPDSLTVFAGNELLVWASSTFTPGGEVTISANAQSNDYDGSLYVAGDATFNTYATTTLSVGGNFVLDTSASFDAASSTVLFTATTTGKSIIASDTIMFNEVEFNGVVGGWGLSADIEAEGDMLVNNGTVSGTGDITLPNGDLSGNGVLDMTGGTTTIASTNTFGGISDWTLYNLQFGDTFQIGTTTPVFTGTTTILGMLKIESAHYLDAGATSWNLAGTGDVLVETGTFIEDTSTVRYSGASANVLSTQYYNLDINASSGPQTYVLTGLGTIIDGDLTVGGEAATTFDVDTNDALLDVNGDVYVSSNGTLSLSDSASTTFSGNYDNDGTLTPNGGTITFDGSGTTNIAAGNSSFANVELDGTADIVITEHATATNAFDLTAVNTFAVSSGESLTVSGNFFNAVGGGATTWTGSTLRIIGGNDYAINDSTTSDTYNVLDIGGGTQIRMWNSDASTYDVFSTGSLYSQDHNNIDGDLYIWGAYQKSNANDYWSYTRDFNGTDLSGGSERKVDVYLATSSSVTVEGGSLDVTGDSSASTTIQSSTASETYSLTIGGTASTSWTYYEIRDIDSDGIVLTSTPSIQTLSFGDLEVSQTGGSAMTVGGTVINANPAKNFNQNRFALNGAASGFNVTATGTSVSSWRFANHYGDIDGEGFDVDPDGDPGYVVWDDSAASITIAGNVYADDTTTVSSVCGTADITLQVAGITTATTSCNGGTGAYSFSDVSYGPTDSLVVYISGVTEEGASVTKEPISNITNLDIYENHVIVRHENTDPISIADMAVWDSSDDADIPFTAVDAGTDTLTLPTDYKLVVWDSKTFEPAGNVTLTNGGVETYGGSLELYASAIWSGQGTESLSVGGSMELGTDATYTASNGTTTFTTTGSGRVIDVNEGVFSNVEFTGSGDWSISDPTLSVSGDATISAGTLTLPVGTTTLSGSFINSGGAFDANNGLMLLDGVSTQTVTLGGSDAATVLFTGGDYVFGDTSATTTGTLTIESGDITLPSGSLTVGGDFDNSGGAITHNTSELIFSTSTTATLLASTSDLYSVTFSGGGTYEMLDNSLSLVDTLLISSGSLTLASGTLSIGGSFDATGGTFDNATGTILFNSGDTGEIIDPGASDFYRVQISAPSGGYTLVDNATTSQDFVLTNVNSFTAQSGSILVVEGVFLNDVGGANTTWSGSTLKIDGQNAYTINSSSTPTEQYETLIIGANSDIRIWNSVATTTTVDNSSSLYSQDHGGVDGSLNIYGDFHIATATEYWSYATDFNGDDISGGNERAVTVALAANATTTVDGGTLNIVGVSGNETTVTNQGSGTYAMEVSDGTFNAQYYAYRNLNSSGLNLSGTPTIASLSYGDFELAVNTGNLISLSSTTLNANASLLITGNRFATTTAISGNNVSLTGVTSNAWTFVSHTGNIDGEDYDVDGATLCGSLRWDDSTCQLTQQTHYRWRNDDGGLGIPDSEWYDANWDARKRVRIDSSNTNPVTNAAVQLLVDYDADMQSDFDDLRFTSADGLTLLSHWTGSTTNGVAAEVWLELPTLPAESATSVYMYYNNPSATTTSSSTQTFIASDDFEDGNISEYSGQTSLFSVDSSFAFDGSNGLDNTGNESGRTTTGGIYRTDQTVSVGETFRFKQYVVATSSDETCAAFASQGADENYAVCFRMIGDTSERISLVEDAHDNDTTAPANTLASSSITFSTGWYEVEVDWSSTEMFVSVYDEGGTLAATTSGTSTSYSSGGIGFTYWFNNGGWDSVHSRPIVDVEPTITFGSEQVDGGASWAAAEDSPGSFSAGDTARLRLAVENSGTPITGQQFQIEYAEQDTAPSCEAVDGTDYQIVPVQSSCGTSPVCMQGSTNVTNGASTFDVLQEPVGDFTAGEAREDPSNTTGNIDVGTNEFTEIEYVITPTSNATDSQLCFRVTDGGSEYDTYLRVAKMILSFDPVIDTIVLNNALPISLLPGTTTQVYATGTVSDGNGYTDLVLATSTFYRSGVTGGAACTPDNNNCYISTTTPQCQFTNCAGDSCDIECYADIFFHADPTDSGSPYDGQEWFAFVEVEDSFGGVDFETSIGQEMNTLRAITVDQQINYGSLEVNNDTGSDNASTSVANQGNVEVNVEVQGTDLSDGASSVIPTDQQKFATSTFNYSSCGAICGLVSSTTFVEIDVDLGKPTIDSPPVEDEIYWGIAVPIGVKSAPHNGLTTFTPISP